jgi:hypothetical protein
MTHLTGPQCKVSDPLTVFVRCLGIKKGGQPCDKLFRSRSRFHRFCSRCEARKEALERGMGPMMFASVRSEETK